MNGSNEKTSKKTAVEKLGQYLRFGSRLGLDRIKKLLELLGDPQEGMKVIHVAGTNGKGSVCRFIYEMLEASGYRVGLYSSPYIETFNERIEYHGEYITDEELEICTDKTLAAADKMVAEGMDSPTEFEVVTAAAVAFFQMKDPDFVILEVGLGGRGDSTNITDSPLVSVITSISYDHMDRLGDTLTEIAMEKAGIIKPGVPVVSGVYEEEAAKVIAREAYRNGSVLYDTTRYRRKIRRVDAAGCAFDCDVNGTEYGNVEISMGGEHQIDNAVCALATIEILRKSGIIKVERPALDEGIGRAKQKGRFEVFDKKHKYVLDGAHNREGMEALVKAMDDCFYGKNVLTIIGVLADKAVDDILDAAVCIGNDFIAVEPDNPRKLDSSVLAEKLKARGRNCITAKDPKTALAMADSAGEDHDVILGAGSLYLIGELRRLIKDD